LTTIKSKFGFILILGFAFAIIMGIIYYNDHKECKEVTKSVVIANGETIITKSHICKEQFNF